MKENFEVIKVAALSNFKKDATSLKTAEQFKEADELLFTWFMNIRSQKNHVNGRLFKRFKSHSRTSCVTVTRMFLPTKLVKAGSSIGESADILDLRVSRLSPIIAQYESRNVFNADETTLPLNQTKITDFLA